MVSILTLLLLIGFSPDWARNCKPVNYAFKQYNAQQYGSGCKKGCFGWANVTAECYDGLGNSLPGCVDYRGRIAEGDHYKQERCVECEMLDAKLVISHYVNGTIPDNITITINDTELEKACNGDQSYLVLENDTGIYYPSSGFLTGTRTCFWNGKRCGPSSCPRIVRRVKCSNGNWTGGKCLKKTNSDCRVTSFLPSTSFPGSFYTSFYLSAADFSTTSGCVSYLKNGTRNSVDNNRWVICDDLVKLYHSQKKFNENDYECIKFTSDHVKDCKYKCENPNKISSTSKYEYTKASRKFCHQVYGCLYSASNSGVSTWSVWAYVLTLVILIVVVVGVVGVGIFLMFKYKIKGETSTILLQK